MGRILVVALAMLAACEMESGEMKQQQQQGASCWVQTATIETCDYYCLDEAETWPNCTIEVRDCGRRPTCSQCNPVQGGSCTWQGSVKACYSTESLCEQ